VVADRSNATYVFLPVDFVHKLLEAEWINAQAAAVPELPKYYLSTIKICVTFGKYCYRLE